MRQPVNRHVHSLLAALWACGTGAGLLLLWPLLRAELRGTVFAELWMPLIPVYVVLGLWIAEAIWAKIPSPRDAAPEED